MSTAVNEAVTLESSRSRKSLLGWVLAGLAALAVSVAVVIVSDRGSSPEPLPAVERPNAASSMLYSPEELIVKRLALAGHIPAETLTSESFVTKRLVNLGLIPEQALADESALIRELVNRGLVPAQAADSRAIEK